MLLFFVPVAPKLCLACYCEADPMAVLQSNASIFLCSPSRLQVNARGRGPHRRDLSNNAIGQSPILEAVSVVMTHLSKRLRREANALDACTHGNLKFVL